MSTVPPAVLAKAQALVLDMERIEEQIMMLADAATQEGNTQELSQQIKNLENDIQEREAEIMAEVSVETKDGMSAALRFTNDKQRNAEVKIRCGRDTRLQGQRRELDQLGLRRFNLQLVQSQAENRMKALIAVKDSKVARAGLLQAILGAWL